jgi:serine/threonine-protein phosphatase 2A regulatory subunit B
VTAVEFDETGQYLAVGDKAGRICIFEGHTVTASPNSNKRPIIPLEYKFYTEFQSHEPEFDCLKSLEIEEKINMIKWGKKMNNGLFLLACNGQQKWQDAGAGAEQQNRTNEKYSAARRCWLSPSEQDGR